MKKNSDLIITNGITILLFLFINIFLTSALFIFNIEISKANFILSIIIYNVLAFILINKQRQNYKKTAINLIVIMILIISSIFISGMFIDPTADGNSYHKTAIGSLADGWNPVYENIEDFNSTSSFQLNEVHSTWTNHYAKASWYYSANLYSFTNNIESGKSFLILLSLSLFLVAFGFFIKKTKTLLSIIIALLIFANPVYFTQIITNYNDGIIYVLTTMLIISMLMILDKKEDNKSYLLYFLTLVILINIKFTGFAFAGIYSLFFYLYSIVNKNRDFNIIKRFTIVGAIGLIVGVAIVGLATYPKNLFYSPHIFHPLYGDSKVDIMTSNQPASFKERSQLSKFILGNFSKSSNIYEATGLEPELKIPLTVDRYEYYSMSASDLRIGGFGPFFGVILILSLLIIIILSKQVINISKNNFNMLMIFLGTTVFVGIILEGSWWARYFPQLYLIVICSLIFLLHMNKSKIKTLFIGMYLILVIANSSIYALSYFSTMLTNQVNFKNLIKTIDYLEKEYGNNLYFYTDGYTGLHYNIRDYKKNIEILASVNNNYLEVHNINDMVKIYVKVDNYE